MKVNYTGCALCNSTWGDYWQEIEGKNLFFCCKICATSFLNMIQAVKVKNTWPTVDKINIKGGVRGRTCTAWYEEEKITFDISFTSVGKIREMQILTDD